MTGHTAPPRGRVSLLGVIAGGLLIGAGGFGLFRVTSANPAGDLPPLPPLAPVSEPRQDPVGLSPVIPAGAPAVPVILPGGVLPPLPAGTPPDAPVLPPVGDLPKPGEVGLPPAPLPPPPVPAAKPPVAPPPKPADVPPVGLEPPPLPELPGKPAVPVPQTPELAPLPGMGPPTPPIQPANPDLNLRPPTPGNTVNPKAVPGPGDGMTGPAPGVTVLPTPLANPLDPLPLPGDPPVTFNLRRTVLAAAVGLSLTPNALRAQEPKDGEKPMKPADEPDLKKQIADLKKEVDALRKQNEVQADFILGRADGKEPLTAVDRGLLKRVATLEEAIKRIEGRLDAMAAGGGAKQVVGSSPIGTPGTGTVRLINEYPTDVEIVVNGVSHKLKANELKELAVPSGEFVYELMAAGASKTTSTIKDAERVTLRIR